MNLVKEIARFSGLTKTSVGRLRKVPALTGTATSIALNAVVGTSFIPITSTFRIGFSGTPAAVCGAYHGLICTGFVGATADTLKYIIRPDGLYFPGFAVDEFLAGMIYDCFFYKKKITLLRVIIARVCITVSISLISTSLWLSMMYQSSLSIMVRLIKNVVMLPVDVALLYAVFKNAERVRKIQPCNIEKLRFEW